MGPLLRPSLKGRQPAEQRQLYLYAGGSGIQERHGLSRDAARDGLVAGEYPDLRRAEPAGAALQPDESGNGQTAARVSDDRLRELLRERVRRIFTIAAIHEDQVLILGAFGCGTFRNPPDIVADAFYSVMQDFSGYFETVEYAVYCPQRDRTNLEVFRRTMQK